MARPLSWSEVLGGVIALVVIAGAAIAILMFSRVGALRGDTFPLVALVSQARGLAPGSEVWLSGQRVGKVTKIRFRSPAESDTAQRVAIEMDILSRYRDAVHHDAVADVRTGGSLMGPIVVYLTPGTTGTPAMRDNDTVVTGPKAGFDRTARELGTVTKELPAIMADVKLLGARLRSTDGTVGAVLNGSGMSEVTRARAQVGRLAERMNGDGTVGLVLRGGLSTRAGRVMARVDSVRALLASPNTSFGRFRRDSSLLREVADIRGELAEVRAALDEPRGTAGRVLRDSALTDALADAQREMAMLFADIKKRPLRYISF